MNLYYFKINRMEDVQGIRDILEKDNYIRNRNYVFFEIKDDLIHKVKLLLDELIGEEKSISTFPILQENSLSGIKDFNLQHSFLVIYKLNKSIGFRMEEIEPDYIDSRITKRGNKVSQLTIPAGIRCEAEEFTFNNFVGGEQERIKILNQEGIIIKAHSLMNEVVLEGPFCNPRYIKQFFLNRDIVDRRGQKLVEVYFTKTGIPYLRKEKLGTIHNSIFYKESNIEFNQTSIYHKLSSMVGEGSYIIPINLSLKE